MITFQDEITVRVNKNKTDLNLQKSAQKFIEASTSPKYSYNFLWLGRPIIQYPQDIVAMQEIIWEIKPDLMIETGIAHGGSLIFYASLLELNAICGGPQDAEVLGIDIDIRPHNREAIESHPMIKRISMIEGSSLSSSVIEQVKETARTKKNILVCLDSNHTHDHVLQELEAYAPLTSMGSYCVVFDTIIEHLPLNSYPDRPWNRGNNPKSAAIEYLKKHPEFESNDEIDNKLLISVAPGGYLKRIKR